LKTIEAVEGTVSPSMTIPASLEAFAANLEEGA